MEGEDDVGLEALVHSAETAGQKVEVRLNQGLHGQGKISGK